MILKRAQEIDRFLSAPSADLRAAVIYGGDPGLVSERAETLSRKVTARPDDPFDVAIVGDGDLGAAPERLHDELRAVSMMGGRRLATTEACTRVRGQRIGGGRSTGSALTRRLQSGRLPVD